MAKTHTIFAKNKGSVLQCWFRWENRLFQSNLNIDEIRKRIDAFRERARTGIPDIECSNEILSIFGDNFRFSAQSWKFEVGTQFFRARPIPNDDTNIPLKTMAQVGDAWEPPQERVKVQGRLNAVGQSILYCCAADPDLAIDEARARENNHVAVIVYRAVQPISVSIIGSYTESNLSKDSMSEIFYSFLDEEFSTFVSHGDEGKYSVSRGIADTFFNYPDQDAWCYRSVQSSSKFNVAFLPKKPLSCLELSGVMICDLRKSIPGRLEVKFVVDFEKVTGLARYHPIGSEEQKRIFPKIE